MFHRRLLLLLAAACAVNLVLALQVANLTVIQGAGLRREAEKALVSRKLIRTVRGSIHDRCGRLLARDHPSYDVAVDYAVLTDQWAHDCARGEAREDHKAQWHKLSEPQRVRLSARYHRGASASRETG